ncbi:hypothetical protein [Enterococcus mundtii]|uniref:hypothetical protein n=1 Tax=Enterococcus mundtii TaxID=53346 RepID=UPI001F61DEC0|nr:hypothetical protein [Enterococcus mundtii]
MNYSEVYKRKISRRGGNAYERAAKNKSRDFKEYFQSTLNLEECFIDTVLSKAVFQDHSQSNNKDLSDDKYIIVPNETKISVGSYVDWRHAHWLVFTEEFKTIPSHQQLKIKIVNENIKWIKNKKICNDGKGWGAYVQNQTLYTLGIARQGNHLDLVNSKMMLYMQNNKETRSLNVGDRIFCGFTVYKIMFRDGVSRNGLINYLLEEDTLKSDDNVELRIADYYKSEVLDNEVTHPEKIPVINGNGQGRLGRTYKYTIQEGYKVDEWILDTAGTPSVEILERDGSMITLRIKDDRRNVGSVVTLMAKVNDNVSSFSIRISNKY